MSETPPTPRSFPQPAVKFAWRAYRELAAASRRAKADLTQARLVVLVLTLAGAVLGALSGLRPDFELSIGDGQAVHPLGLLIALCTGAAGYFGREILKPEREQLWISARSAAEALKSHTYLFVTGTPPYDASEDAETRFNALVQNVGKYRKMARLGKYDQPADDSRLTDVPAGPMAVGDYVKERLTDQITWYEEAAAKHKRIADIGQKTALCFGLVATLLGVLAGFGLGKWTSAWVAVCTTSIASVGAYVYSERRQYFVTIYRTAAEKLRGLNARWDTFGATKWNAEERSGFIAECEAIMQAENSEWMTRLTDDAKTTGRGARTGE